MRRTSPGTSGRRDAAPGDRRSTVRLFHPAVVICAALGAVALGVVMSRVPGPGMATARENANASEWWFADYPELRRTSRGELEWFESIEGPVGSVVGSVTGRTLTTPPGPDGENLLRHIVERTHAGAAVYSRADGLLRERATLAAFIGDVATARTDRVLARIVLDRRVDPANRCTAVIALTRNGTTAEDLGDVLSRVALDATADPRLRRTALAGLRHRRIAPPPELLRLIDEPFFELDRHVRAMFEGRPEAAVRLARPEPSRHMTVRALDSWKSVSLCPPEKLDPAVASALLLHDAETAARVAESLDRLARSVSADVAAAGVPLAKLRVISSRLPVDGERNAGDDDSDVALTLLSGGGNCVARSLIVAGVARRLGLPVQYVTCPNHMFLRLDDGEVRVNFDPARGDVCDSDAIYELEFDCGSGVCQGIRPIDSRGATSIVCSNKAWRLHDASLDEEAVAWTDRALELDPGNQSALIVRASALSRVSLPPHEDAVAALRAAEQGGRWSVLTIAGVVRTWISLSEPDEAARAIAAVAACRSGDANLRWARVLHLAATAHPDRAEAEIVSFLDGARESPETRSLRRAIARRRGDESWRPVKPPDNAAEAIEFVMLANWLLDTTQDSEADARAILGLIPEDWSPVAEWQFGGTNREPLGPPVASLRTRLERIAAARQSADAPR